MQKPDRNQRRDFLRKIPVVIASIGAFSLFKFQKSIRYPEIKIRTISKAEAEDILKKQQFAGSKRVKPKPAPTVLNSKG